MRDVYFILSPHFMLLDLAGPAEVLQIASEHGAKLNLVMAAAVPELVSSVGLRHHQLAALPRPIPDGALIMLIGVQNSLHNLQHPEAQAIVAWLKAEFNPIQHQLACICSGTLIAAQAGLLNARRCTTHHELIARLGEMAPTALIEENRLFVEDGPIATSAGITAGIDLALHLVARDFGASMTQSIAREMVVWLRRSGQDPQLSAWLAHRNHIHPQVHKAQDLISQQVQKRWPLTELATAVHCTPRTLSRLFIQHAGLTPHEYQKTIRLALAQQLLATADLTVDEVAHAAGFASTRDFRRVWQQDTGKLPSQCRGIS